MPKKKKQLDLKEVHHNDLLDEIHRRLDVEREAKRELARLLVDLRPYTETIVELKDRQLRRKIEIQSGPPECVGRNWDHY